jgi:predicted phosphodiesterase
MRVAVFGDVHGNLIALERFVQATRSSVESYLCLGDVVNYGPWNDECLVLVEQLPGITVLEGNHERLFQGLEDLDHELPLVRDFYLQSHKAFSRPDLIRNLPRQLRLGTFECSHTINGRSIYADTAIEIAHDHIIGHTHHQFQVERSGFRIVNPGSVGQNRKWIDMVDYGILDTGTGGVTLHSLPYDVDLFLAELRRRGYPEQCVRYYDSKARKNSPRSISSVIT